MLFEVSILFGIYLSLYKGLSSSKSKTVNFFLLLENNVCCGNSGNGGGGGGGGGYGICIG